MKHMKKRFLLSLIGVLMIIFLVSVILGQDNCPTCPPDRAFVTKDGVYTDGTNLWKNKGECTAANAANMNKCNPATSQDLLNKKEKSVEEDIQKSMTEKQAKGFNELKAEEDLGVKLEGDDLSHGTWKDEKTFVYGKNEFNNELLKNNGITKLRLKGNEISGLNNNGGILRWDGNSFQPEDPKNNPMAKIPLYSNQNGVDRGVPSLAGVGGLGGLGLPGSQNGLGSLGGLDQQFTQALGVVQQLLGLVQQIAGPFQKQRSNGQGETSIAKNNFEGYTSTLDGGAVASFEDNKGNSKLLVGQNDPNNPAKVETKKNNNVDVTNANVIVPREVAAKISDRTSLTLAGTPGNDPNNQAKTSSEKPISFKGNIFSPTFTTTIPLIKSSLTEFSKIPQSKTSITSFAHTTPTTGKAISDLGGQSIKLLEHNIEINGHDIDTYALKTFNELNAGGQNLKFYSGDYQIKFNNQQTLVSRLHQDIPYGVKQISNKLDQNNKFTLQHYTNKLLFLTDDNQIVSIGDITTENPTNNRLIIAKIRENMWAKN